MRILAKISYVILAFALVVSALGLVEARELPWVPELSVPDRFTQVEVGPVKSGLLTDVTSRYLANVVTINYLLSPHQVEMGRPKEAGESRLLPKNLNVYIDPELYNPERLRKLWGDRVNVFINLRKKELSRVLDRIAERHGGDLVRVYEIGSWVRVNVPVDSVDELIEESLGLLGGEILAFEAEKMYRPLLVSSLNMINVTGLRDLVVVNGNPHFNGINGSGVIVAVLDTGIDPTHPDFYFPNGTSKILGGWNFIDWNGNITDYEGHGTHVAGTIAGTGLARNYAHSGTGAMYVGTRWRPYGYQAHPDAKPEELFLVFDLNILGYGGGDLKLSLWSLTSFSNYYHDAYGYPVSSALVYYGVDRSEMYLFNITENSNYLEPVWENYVIDLPEYTSKGEPARKVYIKFVYQPPVIILDRGWFLDDIQLLESGTPLATLDFESDVVPSGVYIEKTMNWKRVDGYFEGVAPGAWLLVGKVCNVEGCPTSAILDGMIWASYYGADWEPLTGDEAHVVSMSLGGPATTYDILAQYVDLLSQAYGTVFVIAAGNSGDLGLFTIESPGIAHEAITVGAVQKPSLGFPEDIIFFSSRGLSPVDFWLKPDVVAPGVNIIAPRSSYVGPVDYDWDLDTYYTLMSGTSMATPHVSGAVALIKQVHPTWSPQLIKSALASTGALIAERTTLYSDVRTPSSILDQGGGLINVEKAINAEVIPWNATLNFKVMMPGTEKNVSTQLVVINPDVTSISVSTYVLRYLKYSELDGDDILVDVTDVTPWMSVSICEPADCGAFYLNVSIELPPDAPEGLYDGWVVLETDTGYEFKVVLGLLAMKTVRVYGYVLDEFGNPLPGTEVYLLNATDYDFIFLDSYLGVGFSYLVSNVSDSSGYYELTYELTNETQLYELYMMVEGKHPSGDYYWHRSYPVFRPMDVVDGFYYNMTLVERFTEPAYEKRLLVVADNAIDWEGLASWTAYTAASVVDGVYGTAPFIWDVSLYGRVTSDLLRDFPAVAWFSALDWYPATFPDWYEIYVYVAGNWRNLLIEGEDIGWFHSEVLGDPFLEWVMHAEYVADDSGYDSIVKALEHPALRGISNVVIFPWDAPYPDWVRNLSDSLKILEYWDPSTLNTTGMGAAVWYWTDYRSLYYAFPISYLDDNNFTGLVLYSTGYVIDVTPPQPFTFEAEFYPRQWFNTTLTLLKVNITGPAVDDFGVTEYRVFINDSIYVGSIIPPDTYGEFHVDADWIENVTVVAVDFGGNEVEGTETPVPIPEEPLYVGLATLVALGITAYYLYRRK